MRTKFWQDYTLEELSIEEWEALCDGCGRCCLIKLEDDETEEVKYTNIACRLFDDETCKCGNYALRQQLVKTCVVVRPDNLENIAEWMPETCAYKRLFEGRELPSWHPLITGTQKTVIDAGISMQRKTIPEFDIEEDEWHNHIVEGML